MDLLQHFYETTLEALKEAKNDRLWFKTNTKLGKLYFDREDYTKLQRILKQLHRSCQVWRFIMTKIDASESGGTVVESAVLMWSRELEVSREMESDSGFESKSGNSWLLKIIEVIFLCIIICLHLVVSTGTKIHRECVGTSHGTSSGSIVRSFALKTAGVYSLTLALCAKVIFAALTFCYLPL